MYSNTVEDGRLDIGGRPYDLLALVGGCFAVQLEQLAEVKARALEDLDLAHVAVLQGKDVLARLFNLLANDLGDKLLHEVLEVVLHGFFLDDGKHLLADGTHLGSRRIGCLLELVLAALGERDGEDAHQVAVGGLDVHVRLDERLPLFDQRAQLVGGHLEAVKVGEAALAGDLLDLQLDVAERVVHVAVQVGEAHREHAVGQGVFGVFEALGLVDQRLSDGARAKVRGRLDVEPVLAQKGIQRLLLEPLLALGESLVFAHGH